MISVIIASKSHYSLQIIVPKPQKRSKDMLKSLLTFKFVREGWLILTWFMLLIIPLFLFLLCVYRLWSSQFLVIMKLFTRLIPSLTKIWIGMSLFSNFFLFLDIHLMSAITITKTIFIIRMFYHINHRRKMRNIYSII